ncbi:MAG: CPBP family intramembrane metalloprotease [Akkermansiaceae bacterium]|nr:CPBP family intramembrane metalloprotease [Akkermansiaceae bacterium]MCP5542373.1 CPBP family intramembrane metalloprotease [Akkermansiaceae bacterium]MCP5546092.1 CPBP family intramembrane metalloprotease [Akkermansiaceae bacterium]
MAAGDRKDVCKLWLFPAAVVLLGAWMAPLVYNAGKALAEVSRAKTTNGPIEWLAGRCAKAGFPEFYLTALGIAALVLFLPWIEWLSAGRRSSDGWRPPGPWRLAPGRARIRTEGQALHGYPRGLWHLCAGFLLAAGLTLSLGMALVPAGFGTMRQSGAGFLPLLRTLLPLALLLAAVQEVLFRGVAMGIFLRAMKPSAAIAMTALYFAAIHSLLPAGRLDVADPDAGGTGWEMLSLVLRHLAEGSGFVGVFLPYFGLGALLAYARWRTASLWLPIGLHTGWLFSRAALGMWIVPAADGRSKPAAEMLASGIVPLVALSVVAFLSHILTSRGNDERPVES